MEKRSGSRSLKRRLLGLFRPSSCNLTTRSLPDSVREPAFVSSRRYDHLDVDLMSCRLAPKRKDEGRWPVPENALFCDAGGGKMCPSPDSDQMKRCFVHREKSNNTWGRGRKKNKKKMMMTKKKKKKKILLFPNPYGFTTSSSGEEEEEDGNDDNEEDDDDDEDEELFSSDEREEETDTLFSSRSFSSDSSEFYYNSSRSGRKTASRRRRPPRRGGSCTHDGFRPLVSISSRVKKGYGGDGFPVVKDSDDPYADFKISMLEMIVEKQTFGKGELQSLLRSYLSLNSPHHHPTILKVFSDICELLFCN